FSQSRLEQNGGRHRRSPESDAGCDGFSCLSFETSFASRRLRMGRSLGKSLGGTAGGQQMVSQGDLVNALSLFSGDAAASIESRQNVGPLVLQQSGIRDLVRCGDSLVLRL